MALINFSTIGRPMILLGLRALFLGTKDALDVLSWEHLQSVIAAM